MIEKIQNFINDNISFNITRNQIIIGLAVIISAGLLVIIFMISLGGPQKDASSIKPQLSNNAQPYYEE